MSQTAAASISGRVRTHRTPRCGRRSFAAYYRWVDDALRHRADGYRLLDSPLVGAFAAAPSPTCMRRGRSCSRPPSGPRRS